MATARLLVRKKQTQRHSQREQEREYTATCLLGTRQSVTGQPHMGQWLAVKKAFMWEDALDPGPEAKTTLGIIGLQSVRKILITTWWRWVTTKSQSH